MRLRLVAASLVLTACPSEPDPVGEPLCGDETVDDGEACDDGNLLGGDGCTHLCTVEEGVGETEPNDDAEDAAKVGPLSGTLHGTLLPGDRDCFLVPVDEAAAIRATMLPVGAACEFPSTVEVLGPDGARVSSGLPVPPDGCAAVEPDTDTFARYLVAGDHLVCITPVLDGTAASYTLVIEIADSCTDLPELPPDPSQDHEGDGVADLCDPDDDDDGVEDAVDNCPEVPNGPEQPFDWGTGEDGFVPMWLILGAFDDGETPGDCEPSPDSFTGNADADAAPELGDSVGTKQWFAHVALPGNSAVVRFTDWFSVVPAPREAYAATWVHAPDARVAELAMGSDDGHVAWVNGVEVGRNAGCHGVGTDAFRYPVDLDEGWNRLLIKVYDGGGGWGLVARFYEADGETPMDDLGLSVGGPEDWVDDQTDSDGDGEGDLCDRTP